MLELLNPSWDASDSKRFRQEIEDWVIENGVTDTTYFYLGQLISDALQVIITAQQILKIIKNLGPALARLSAILSGGGGGLQLAAAGVGAYALDAGISAGTASALVDAVGLIGAGVAIAFMDVSGIGYDADKFVEALTEGNAETDIPNYIKENRVPLDKETVLKGQDYQKTGKKIKGAQIYKKGNQYYYRDTFHIGESAHLEVFDKRGKHLGEADPLTGILKPGTADPTKMIDVK